VDVANVEGAVNPVKQLWKSAITERYSFVDIWLFLTLYWVFGLIFEACQ
jgi:hypothetical protein